MHCPVLPCSCHNIASVQFRVFQLVQVWFHPHTTCPSIRRCQCKLRTEALFPFQMAVLISVGFLSSWTPYAAASFWSIFNSSDSLQPIATLLPCLFAKSSTAYNPFVYYIFSKTFRREIKQLQCCCGWRVHFFSTDNSAENPVSMMWSGRDNVRLSSAAKVAVVDTPII